MDKFVVRRNVMSFSINNRRYTGCKAKLTTWIHDTIVENCNDCNSFCDLFAGTGVVTNALVNEFGSFYINDFLYSNEIIYKAFFLKKDYSEEKIYGFYSRYTALDPSKVSPNFVSENYGGKFFSEKDALLIGEIREDIEFNKHKLNEKEYAILLASLLYSADRSSNTCGHYDAYIKNKNIRSSFRFELVEPIIKNQEDPRNIQISRIDSNKLVSNITCDVVYIDPPYSSRQYSRFYHVLETITKWDKPKLFGEAIKPAPENMSEYCKSKALDAFKQLIYSLNAKYIVVSYNNTYDSKSSSSKNKMELEDIKQVMLKKGETKIYHMNHKPFNAGKTSLDNHQEILFVTEVGVFR